MINAMKDIRIESTVSNCGQCKYCQQFVGRSATIKGTIFFCKCSKLVIEYIEESEVPAHRAFSEKPIPNICPLPTFV